MTGVKLPAQTWFPAFPKITSIVFKGKADQIQCRYHHLPGPTIVLFYALGHNGHLNPSPKQAHVHYYQCPKKRERSQDKWILCSFVTGTSFSVSGTSPSDTNASKPEYLPESELVETEAFPETTRTVPAGTLRAAGLTCLHVWDTCFLTKDVLLSSVNGNNYLNDSNWHHDWPLQTDEKTKSFIRNTNWDTIPFML